MPVDRIPKVSPGETILASHHNRIADAVNSLNPSVASIRQLPNEGDPYTVLSVKIARVLGSIADAGGSEEWIGVYNTYGPCLACYRFVRKATGVTPDEMQDNAVAVYLPDGIEIAKFKKENGTQIYDNRPGDPTWVAVRVAGVYRLVISSCNTPLAAAPLAAELCNPAPLAF